MAGELVYLEAIVGADISSFRRGMAEVRGEIAETTGLSGGLIGLGTSLALGLTVPIVALGVASIKVFSDFDSGMRNINSIMQLPEDQLKKLSAAVLKFGEDTRNGSTAATEALYTIVSAGFGINNTAEAMKVLDIATKGAEAGLANTNTVAQVLAQSLLAYGEDSSFAAHNMDVLTQAVNLGVGSMDDVSSSVGQAINSSALLKISWSELNETAAFLTQRGMSFANAYTSINGVISSLLKPSEALIAVYNELGVTGGTELVQKFGGLNNAIKAVSATVGDNPDILAKLFGNIRAFRDVASVIGNLDDFNAFTKTFEENLDGVTGKAQQQQLKSFASQFDYMVSHIRGFLTAVGADIAPALGVVTDVIGEFFGNLSDLDPIIIQNTISVLALAAAIPLVMIAIGALLSPIGQLVVIGAVLVKAWNDNFLGIQDAVKNALPVWTKGLNDIHLALITFYVNASDIIVKLIDLFNQYLSTDMSHLLRDLFIGNWEQARMDLAGIIVDIQNLILNTLGFNQLSLILNDGLNLVLDAVLGDWDGFKKDVGIIWSDIMGLLDTNIIIPLTTFFNSNVLPGIKQGLGDLLSGIKPDDITGLAAGLGAIIIPLAILGIIAGVSALPAFLVAIAAGLSAILVPLLPILLPIGLIIGLIWAWKTNAFGLRDEIDKLGRTLTDFATNPLEAVRSRLSDILDLIGKILPGFDILRGFIGNPTGAVSGGEYHGKDLVGNEPNPNGISPPPTGYWIPNAGVIETPGGSGTPFPTIGTGFGTGNNGSMSINHNQIIIQTNDPDQILRELRRRGIDLTSSRRG